MRNFHFLIIIVLNYLLISCTPAKVDFSGSQLNNLKYIFTPSSSENTNLTLYPGQNSVLDFKTSDKINDSLRIKIQYQVLSPLNTDIALILEDYKTTAAISSGEKNFSIPLTVKSSLAFAGNAELKINLSSEDDTVEISPNEYKVKIINAAAPSPEISFNATTYINLLNKTTYLVSGACANVTQFTLLINSLSYTVNCSASFWSHIADLSSLADGTITLRLTNEDQSIEYQSTTAIKDTVKPTVSSINDSVTHNSTSTSPTITWIGSDLSSGISKYEIALGSSSSLQDMYPWTDIATVNSQQLTGLSLTNGSTYYVQLRATDAAGNTGDPVAGDGFLVNTSLPLATLSNKPNSMTNVSSYAITVEGTNIIEYKYKVGVSASTDCAATSGYSTVVSLGTPITGTTSSDETYKVCVVGKNSSLVWQNYSSATSYTWTYDNTDPSLSISSPANATYANSSNYTNFPVSTTCSESGLSVNFQASNSSSFSASISNSNTCSSGSASSNFDFSTLPEGIIYLRTYQTDLAGNIGYSLVISVTKDTVFPIVPGSITMVSYFNSTTTSPSFSWSTGDDSGGTGINGYKVAVGSSPGGSDRLSWTFIGNNTNYTATGLTLSHAATYYVSVEAKDNAGNYSSPISASWVVDSAAPSMTITTPTSGSYITTSNQSNVTLTSSCETGLSITLSVTSLVNGSFTNSNILSCAGGSATTGFDVSSYPEGNIQFSVTQTDLAGNTGNTSINILKDLTAPVLSGNIADGTYYNSVSSSPVLTWATASSAGAGLQKYQISLGMTGGGSEVVGWTDVAVNNYQFTGIALTEGATYYPSVRAIDLAGNISNVINGNGWMVDSQAPSVPTGIIDGNQSSSITTSPFLSWNSSTDSISGLNRYEVRLLNSSDTEIVSWTSTGTSPSFSFSGLALSMGNIYHIEVRAIDNAGNVSSAAVGDGWLVVSPGWKSESFIKASNADPSDFFGGAVAIDGDTMVASAYAEDSIQTTITNGSTPASFDNSQSASGAVYVYKRIWNDTIKRYDWQQEAYLKAPNADSSDNFGNSVAISGDTVVVGAYGESAFQTTITNGTTASSNNSYLQSGAVYVFKRTGVNWSQEAFIKASNANTSDYFGYHVGISGDTIVVGVPYEDSNQTTISLGATASADNSTSNSGAAYVFRRSGTIWSQEAYLKPPNTDTNDYFGYSVSISGDTIVVGVPYEDSNQTTISTGATASADNSTSNSGAAYVFRRSGTIWSHEAYLKPPNVGAEDYFGYSVSISGDAIVVGVPYEDSDQTTIINGATSSSNDASSSSGAAYVFRRSGTIWSHEAYLKPPNVDSGDAFGFSVTIFNDTIVIGAHLEDSPLTTITNGTVVQGSDSSSQNYGAAYVFQRATGNWENRAYIKAPNAGFNDLFGKSLGISGNTIVVGVPNEDSSHQFIQNQSSGFTYDDGAAESGAAYIFKFD